MRGRGKLVVRLLKIAAALALLTFLYAAADWREVGRVLLALDHRWLAAALALFIPQTALSAYRWRRLVAPLAAIGFGESLRQTLAASALNLAVPSKLGDLSKAAMLPLPAAGESPPTGDQRRGGLAYAGGLTLAEKGADVAALALLWLAGAAGASGPSLSVALGALFALGGLRPLRNSRCYAPAVASVVLWSLHLLQIDCFLKAAGVFVAWPEATARLPAAIFAGLAPISFCGIGTRDSALLWLFSGLAPAPAMAAVGALTALRYLVPGVAGIPCLLYGSRDRRPRNHADTAHPTAMLAS